MHLTMFQSDQGDCLLLADAAKKTHVLVDGGMPGAYRKHVAAAMGKLRKDKRKLDLIYVSHIDRDHIGGVLKLLDDEVAWRVHEHHKKNGNTAHKSPKVPRPPAVGGIWHNAFHEQIKNNAGDIEDALAASAPVLLGAESSELRRLGVKQSDLATSIAEAIQVSRRVGPAQLGIPLNAQGGGKLMMLRKKQQPITLGGLSITILGPSAQHLRDLQDEWNAWLRKSRDQLKKIRAAARVDQDRLGTSDFDRLLNLFRIQAEAMGNPEDVTAPNVASLTLLVEEGDQSLLLTGDARWQEVIDGLEATGHLGKDESIAIDIVKVPHHGSENNVGETELLDRVVGKHYLFCGNGHSDNPELEVIEAMAKSRLEFEGRFTFWFNHSAAVAEKPPARKHMATVEKLVRDLAAASGDRMKYRFLETGSSLKVV
jgi:beta-lactamase superfamily II metal-dependent hydrolase